MLWLPEEGKLSNVSWFRLGSITFNNSHRSVPSPIGKQEWRSGKTASPPTNVAWAQFWHGALCGLSVFLVLTLSQGFFSTYWTQSLVFLPLQKLTIQISIEQGKGTCMKTSQDWCGFLYIVIYLFIYFIYWFMNCDTFILLYNYSSFISLIVINRMKKPATSWRRRNWRKI